MKVLYIFSGERKNKFKGISGINYPDTQFYGMNHLKEFGINAEYKEFESTKIGKFIAKIIGFRAKHFFMYFVARKYDLVFGISVIYMLFWKKVIPTKTKFVIFNSVLNRMLIVHKPGSIGFKILFWLLGSVDGIVFLSHFHLDNVISKIPFLNGRCYFVAMGVDREYYKPHYDDRSKFYLSVGRDNARDYKTIIDVARKMPNEEFHLVCLPRNIKDIPNIPSNVFIHINIPRVKLDELYRNARALLLIMHNDTYVEGSDSSGPTVLLEAMAIGLPIIASKKEYLRDYIKHGEDALLVDFYDVDAIIKSINSFSDESFRTKLAINSRHKVDKIFNTKEMAGNLSKIFHKIHETTKNK